ncbi:MAG: acetylglutamate kinase [Rhodothermia bacterium]|nr:acetylglutamate kinase [Rhodothermia bacterium]
MKSASHSNGVSGGAPAVVKIGGALVTKDLVGFWTNVRILKSERPVIVVHGGGPEATRVARMLGHEPKIVQGRRVTTARDLEIMEWVARGSLNTRLVGQALACGVDAVGLSGVDGALVQVDRRPPWNIDGQEVDFGYVGDVRKVDTRVLDALLAADLTPVIGPLGVDDAGQAYNVNADTIASSVAATVGAGSLLLVTETGSLRDAADGGGSVVTKCNLARFNTGIQEGWISGGMRVKLKVAFDALDAGVSEVLIIGPDDLLDRSHATQVVA